MIDYLTFIEELKKIRETNNTNLQIKVRLMLVIDQTVEKYENMVNEFEKDRDENRKYMSQENQQKITLDNAIVS